MRRLGTRVAAVGTCAAVVLAGAAAHAASTTPARFSFSDLADGQQVTAVVNDGAGDTDQAVVTSADGAAVAGWSRVGTGMAVRFPAYDGAVDAARAVVSVTNAGSADELEPRAKDFWFGADAKLDATSTGSAYDNGNNLVQRGLAGDRAQYKLQVDGDRFSCRVKGDDGVLMLTSSLTVATATWYHVVCRRLVDAKGDHLVLIVARIKANGELGTVSKDVSKVRRVGALSFAKATPFSIGGKLVDASTIAEASDQWNGMVDNAFVTIRS